jgi:hypothetical protein
VLCIFTRSIGEGVNFRDFRVAVGDRGKGQRLALARKELKGDFSGFVSDACKEANLN